MVSYVLTAFLPKKKKRVLEHRKYFAEAAMKSVWWRLEPRMSLH